MKEDTTIPGVYNGISMLPRRTTNTKDRTVQVGVRT